jgi:methane monooxygenase PmoA-like
MRLAFQKLCLRALLRLLIVAAVGLAIATAQTKRTAEGVQVVPNTTARRVDVYVGGQPFTAYIWPATLKKPVLYPLRTPRGTPVTRGFPLEPREGERVDHPHHVGLWLNYGDVNGVDFWNNSSDIEPDKQSKMGTILHTKIVGARSFRSTGELEVEMEWIMPDAKPVLRENTKFVFHAGPRRRAIDRITTLTALDKRVVFNDTKEGMLGLRAARQLEQPANGPAVLTDASGKPHEVRKPDNTVSTGLYRSSEGKTGDQVWGTRGPWVTLAGKIGQEQVTVAILDHPANPGYPTYWHVRGYGLFAANPLGQAALSGGKQKLQFTLEPGQSATFRYRILILSNQLTPHQVWAEHTRFVNEHE